MFNELAKEINATAKSKGFWDHERNMGEMLMLAVSELSEALEEDRDHNSPVWYRHSSECDHEEGRFPAECTCTPKPEGAVVELADCVIRCLDTLYNYDLETPLDIDSYVTAMNAPYYMDHLPQNFGECLLLVTKELASATRENPLRLIVVIIYCRLLIERYGFDMIQVMREKMTYNSTREHMHGKAY